MHLFLNLCLLRDKLRLVLEETRDVQGYKNEERTCNGCAVRQVGGHGAAEVTDQQEEPDFTGFRKEV